MIGPFKVLKKLSQTSYEVECDKKGRTKDVFQVSKLRLCNPLQGCKGMRFCVNSF